VIEYINTRCNQWAEWRERKAANGLGFPRECVYTRLTPRDPTGAFDPNVDESAWEVDQAIRALPDYLNRSVVEFYLRNGTVDQKARAVGCAPRTLFDRIHMAHNHILDWLNTEAAGLPHEPLANSPCARRTVSV